jgi:isoleucyl-tRNA synthetase
LYHLTQAFVRWMSPILSFTAQEAWPLIPEQTDAYVFTAEWYDIPQPARSQTVSAEQWQTILQVKAAVNKQLEAARAAKQIGGNLSASVLLFVEESLQAALQALGDELRFVLITSAAVLAPLASAPAEAIDTELAGLRVLVQPAEGSKCARCWHIRPDIGEHPHHPGICSRCVANVVGQGEERHYA